MYTFIQYCTIQHSVLYNCIIVHPIQSGRSDNIRSPGSLLGVLYLHNALPTQHGSLVTKHSTRLRCINLDMLCCSRSHRAYHTQIAKIRQSATNQNRCETLIPQRPRNRRKIQYSKPITTLPPPSTIFLAIHSSAEERTPIQDETEYLTSADSPMRHPVAVTLPVLPVPLVCTASRWCTFSLATRLPTPMRVRQDITHHAAHRRVTARPPWGSESAELAR